MYSAELLDHFEHPRNSGDLPQVNAKARVENPACGDILEILIELSDGKIAGIAFRVKGCVPAMACGSAVTELAKGKSIDDARKISREDVIRAVGSLPPASGHAAVLAVDALRAALKQGGND